MNIACALRWGVTLVGVILTGHCLPRRGTPFQVQGLYRWTALRQGRHVALIKIFVKIFLGQTISIMYFCIKEL